MSADTPDPPDVRFLVEMFDEIGYSADVFDFADVPSAAATVADSHVREVRVEPWLDDEADSWLLVRRLPADFASFDVAAARRALNEAAAVPGMPGTVSGTTPAIEDACERTR